MTVTNGNPTMRVSNREEDSMNVEPSLSGKEIVGFIVPPPEVRSIVEKTATFVAKHGIEFENKIREKEALNPKFAFLNSADPYNTYYRHKVKEAETGFATGASAAPAQPAAAPQAPDAVREHIREKEFVPTEPPKPFDFTHDPSTINGFDLDVIRLTALFVARNGRQFLTQLMNREIRNFQFDFLKPQHSNFNYFTKLVEQYTRIILPPVPLNDLIEQLTLSSGFDDVMSDVKYRVAWEKHQKRIRDRANEESERERVAYNQIDWHEFVVVQTVDYQPSEVSNLPPLCTPKDVGTRILLQQREEAKAACEAVEMDVESDSDEEDEEEQVGQPSQGRDHDGFAVPAARPARAPYRQPAPPTNIPEDVIVRDYDPKKQRAQAKPQADQYIISPLTNEKIPANKLEEHVRYNTVDPQYKIQRDREMMDRVDEDPTNASGTEISRNIAKLAERRTDIFGVGEKGVEQTAIGKKLGEEERALPREAKTIWDGQQSTIDATTRAAQEQARKDAAPPPPPAPPAPPVQQLPPRPPPVPAGIPIPPPPQPLMGLPPGFVPPPPAPFGMIPPGLPPVVPGGGLMIPPIHARGDAIGMPPAKRARLEDDLIAEGLWLQKVNGPIDVLINLPTAAEWNVLGGQEQITIDITSMVANVKQTIQDKTNIPSSKQKLSFDGMFLKDNFSLAYYNMKQNSVVWVQLKERGGRKK